MLLADSASGIWMESIGIYDSGGWLERRGFHYREEHTIVHSLSLFTTRMTCAAPPTDLADKAQLPRLQRQRDHDTGALLAARRLGKKAAFPGEAWGIRD